MKKLAFLLFTVLALASCSSSDDATSDVVLLKKYVVTDTSWGDISTTTISYDGTKFATITYSTGIVMNFTYTGNLITKIEYKNSGTLYQTELYTYDSSERLSSYVRLNHNNSTGTKNVCSYNDDGTVTVWTYTGDLIDQTEVSGLGTISFFANGEVSTINYGSDSRSCTYDDKSNPYRNVTGYGKISWARGAASGIVHNVISETFDGTDIFTSNYTYTYNADGYPTTMTKFYSDGPVVTEFFYED